MLFDQFLQPDSSPDDLKPVLPPQCAVLVEALEDGVCVQLPDSRIVEANQSFAELVGLPLDKIIGRHCSEVFGCPTGEGGLRFCAHAASRASGRPESEELQGTYRGRRLRARVSPVRDEQGKVVAFIMVVRDITSVVAQERELARIEQLSRFGELAAGLAHEIKNPLTGIQGAVDILIQRRSELDPDRQVLENVRREVARINGTVQMLLDRARPRPFDLRRASLTEAVQRAVHLGRHLAHSLHLRRGQDIRVNFSPGAQPITLTMDAAQIEDAVLNLIFNSLEAIDGDGEVNVGLRLSEADHSTPREAVITVADNGHGIPPEALSRIFTPFFTTNPNGTGLGLPAVRRIARAHGGRIEVSSTVGEGTVFSLYLPLDV